MATLKRRHKEPYFQGNSWQLVQRTGRTCWPSSLPRYKQRLYWHDWDRDGYGGGQARKNPCHGGGGNPTSVLIGRRKCDTSSFCNGQVIQRLTSRRSYPWRSRWALLWADTPPLTVTTSDQARCIFIETDRPTEAFADAAKALCEDPRWGHMRAAYREACSGPYEILWPQSLQKFSVK
jgi:hypothetical protein